MIEHLDRVSFELSNRCNMAHLHPRCPAHLEAGKPPENISSQVVFSVLKDLGKVKFTGVIGFHQYGEPMIDPRLFWFLERARQDCPQAKTFVWTNGSTLDQNMLDDLGRVGLGLLAVTAYTRDERKRFEALKVPDGIKLSLFNPGWVEVFGIYTRPEINLKHPCYAPLTDVIVTRSGHMGLCCRDWQRRYIFADLKETSLLDAIELPEVAETYRRLSSGERVLDICRRCGTYRDWRMSQSRNCYVTRF